VLGYDLFNEPFPGTNWLPCVLPNGCATFDRGPLADFYGKLVPALEAADPNHIVFYEPLVLFDLGSQTHVPALGGQRTGMSFHDYDNLNFSQPLNNAVSQSNETGDALLMTEFGAVPTPGPVTTVANLADAFMMSWTYWTYANSTPFQIVLSGTVAPTPPQQGIILNLSLPRTANNVNQAVLQAISRPYPQLVAGTPQSFSFNPSNNTFRLKYSPAGLDGSLTNTETDIVVPSAFYPNGYITTVSGGVVISPPNSELLRIVPSKPPSSTIGVIVLPN
jgi:endoglycosylceramidase